jgi:hypothetical protein
VKNYTYHFEIKDLLTQFLAAFNDCIIKRYDNDRVPKTNIEVRYVLAPKQRVLYDIINEQHNITLPVVAVNMTSVARDNERVFNKLDGFYMQKVYNRNTATYSKIPTPTPVNLTVSLSIIAKFQSDIDQILSNFVPYNNPYIILSWKVPESAGLNYYGEIRSEVLWDGNISLTSPTDLTPSDKYNIVADTTFTIKGWLFKKFEESSNIFVIDTNFYNLTAKSGPALTYNSYFTLSGMNLSGVTESFSISGIPTIKSINARTSFSTKAQAAITENTTVRNQLSNLTFSVGGEWYKESDVLYLMLSSNNTSLYPDLTSISTIKQGTVSGFIIDDYTIVNDNLLYFTLPYTQQTGDFTIVVANEVGWDSSYKSKNIVFTLI